jgi:hypothetical protein
VPGLGVRVTTVRRIVSAVGRPAVIGDGVKVVAAGGDVVGGVVTHVEPFQRKIDGDAELTAKSLGQREPFQI